MIRTAVATRTQQITQNALSRDVVAGPVSRVPAGAAIPLAGGSTSISATAICRTSSASGRLGPGSRRSSPVNCSTASRFGQTREATSFVPRIEVQLSECRDRTQWNTVSLLSDHGKEERIQIGTQRREERTESHRYGQFPKPAMADQIPQEVLIDCRDPAPRSGCRPYPHPRPECHRRSSTSEKVQRARPDPSLRCVFETW